MLLCLAKTDDVRLIASLRVGHVHDDAVEPAEQIDPLLTIGLSVIFSCDDRGIEDGLATNEVQAAGLDVA